MRALIRKIARRLRERYTKPRKRQRRGHLDVRRTLRRNAAWGGVPFLTAWKRKHRDRPKIVAICDVSGSVAQVSDFFLLLIHSLHEVVDDVRSFAFSGHLIEVSDILEKKSPEEAMAEIMSKVGFGSSDYGSSLVDFEKELDERDDAADHGDRARRCPQQQSRSARRHPAPHLRTLQAAGLAQSRRPHGLGLWRFRDAALCDLLQRGAPMRHRASSSSARCPISWRRISNPRHRQIQHRHHTGRTFTIAGGSGYNGYRHFLNVEGRMKVIAHAGLALVALLGLSCAAETALAQARAQFAVDVIATCQKPAMKDLPIHVEGTGILRPTDRHGWTWTAVFWAGRASGASSARTEAPGGLHLASRHRQKRPAGNTRLPEPPDDHRPAGIRKGMRHHREKRPEARQTRIHFHHRRRHSLLRQAKNRAHGVPGFLSGTRSNGD